MTRRTRPPSLTGSSGEASHEENESHETAIPPFSMKRSNSFGGWGDEATRPRTAPEFWIAPQTISGDESEEENASPKSRLLHVDEVSYFLGTDRSKEHSMQSDRKTLNENRKKVVGKERPKTSIAITIPHQLPPLPASHATQEAVPDDSDHESNSDDLPTMPSFGNDREAIEKLHSLSDAASFAPDRMEIEKEDILTNKDRVPSRRSSLVHSYPSVDHSEEDLDLRSESELSTASTQRNLSFQLHCRKSRNMLHELMAESSKLRLNRAPSPWQITVSAPSLGAEFSKVPSAELSRASGWGSGYLSRVLLDEPVGFGTSSKQNIIVNSTTADPKCMMTSCRLFPEGSHLPIGHYHVASSLASQDRIGPAFGRSKTPQRPIRTEDMDVLYLGTTCTVRRLANSTRLRETPGPIYNLPSDKVSAPRIMPPHQPRRTHDATGQGDRGPASRQAQVTPTGGGAASRVDRRAGWKAGGGGGGMGKWSPIAVRGQAELSFVHDGTHPAAWHTSPLAAAAPSAVAAVAAFKPRGLRVRLPSGEGR